MRSLYGNVGPDLGIFISPDIGGWVGKGTPVLFSVGYAGTVASSLTGETGKMLRKVGKVAPVLSLNAGGTNTFGNDTAIAAIDASLAALRAKWGYPADRKVVLCGLSMGFCDLMAWAAARSDQVAGMVGCVGLADLDEQWTANREVETGVGATGLINAAYGGAYNPAVHGPMHSAMQFTQSMPFPVTYFYSLTDELIPVARSQAYAALSNVTAHVIGSTAHGTTSIKATHEHAAFLPALADYTS